MFKVMTEEEQLLKKAQEIGDLMTKVGSITNFMFEKKENCILSTTKIRYGIYIDALFDVKNELSDYYDLLIQKRLDIINSKNK